ncbi:MAG: hypothetical protein PPP58_02145 [Natronomonas sp.]
MITELSETATEYYDKKEQLTEKQQTVSELRSDIFGADSAEIEEQARELFEDVGANDGGGKVREIDSVRQEIADLNDEMTELRTELQVAFAELELPFEETIETRDGAVAFPFDEDLSEAVVRAVEELTEYEAEDGAVELRSEEIVARTDDIGEGITAVEGFVTDVRKTAREDLDVETEEESYSILS